MNEAPAAPSSDHGWNRKPAARRGRSSASTLWNSETIRFVEIVAPDRESMGLLLEEAVLLFPAEGVVTDSSWVVRLQPPAGGAWALELLALVERWLDAAPLPCAKVLYGGRSYLVRRSIDVSPSTAAAASRRTPPGQVPSRDRSTK